MSNKVTEDQEVFEKIKHTKDSDKAHSLVKYDSSDFEHSNLTWVGIDHKTTAVSKYSFTNALFSRVNHNLLNTVDLVTVQKAQTTAEENVVTYAVVYVKLKDDSAVSAITANKMEKGLTTLGLHCIFTQEEDNCFEFLVTDKELTKDQKEDIIIAWAEKQDIDYS